MYVELKSGHGDSGPAWIGTAFFSRTFQTVYFNGQIFKKRQGISGNYRELETGDEYWISGVKKRGTNRHWAGGGKIIIDESVIPEYLELTGKNSLPNTFEVGTFDNVPAKERSKELENEEELPEFDSSIRFKAPHDLSDKDLRDLHEYYQSEDLSAIHKKARRTFRTAIEDLEDEIKKRGI
jgi:hypothetical protein